MFRNDIMLDFVGATPDAFRARKQHRSHQPRADKIAQQWLVADAGQAFEWQRGVAHDLTGEFTKHLVELGLVR